MGCTSYRRGMVRVVTAREQIEMLGPWRTAMAAYEEYAGHHQAPGPGEIPLHDLTGNSDIGGLPEDWYTHPQYYTHGDASKGETRKVQQMYNQVRGNPEGMVDIYRSLPHGNSDFNTGDWVTPSLEYARNHGKHADDPSQDWPVIRSTVPAKHLWHNGDSYFEMGYHGPSHPGVIV